jgi:hypothetical protein
MPIPSAANVAAARDMVIDAARYWEGEAPAEPLGWWEVSGEW